MEQTATFVFLAIGGIMFVFASLQLTARRSTAVNFSLFAVFLSVGYVWFYYGLYRLNRLSGVPWLLYSDIVPTFLVGPLMLMYTLNLIGRSVPRGFRKILPFLPALAVLGYLILFRSYAAVAWSRLPGPNPDHFQVPAVRIINSAGDFHFFVHAAFSAFLAARTYRQGNPRFRRNFRGVPIFYTASLLTFILFFAGHAFRSDNLLGAAVLANGLACVYFFFFCYRYPEYTQKRIRSLGVGKSPAASPAGGEVRRILSDLNRAVEVEEAFRDPSLSLQSLSLRLGIPHHQLSQVLNDHMGMNFRTFVNRLRVNEVKRLLARDSGMTILDIAYSVGFNSKSAFNTAFVKETGRTPSEYRKDRQGVLNS